MARNCFLWNQIEIAMAFEYLNMFNLLSAYAFVRACGGSNFYQSLASAGFHLDLGDGPKLFFESDRN